MNPPTREEFDELKAEVAKLKEQHTEPMRVVLEQRPTEGETLLLETLLRQSGQQATDIGVLKQDVGTLKTDVSTLKQTVARLEQKMDEGFQDMENRFDAIAEVQKLILERLPEKGE